MKYHPVFFLYFFFFSLAVSAILVVFFIRFAPKWGFVDKPGNRKIHTTPTPLLGGAAIFIAINVTYAFHFMMYHYGILNNLNLFFSLPSNFSLKQIQPDFGRTVSYFMGGTFIFLLGLADDKRGLSPKFRLIGEIIIATAVVVLGVKPGFYEAHNIIGFIIMIGWIVGITNAFNLIDGVNGLCAGNAILSSLIFFSISMKGGHNLVGILLMTFTGALTGFFIYNFPKGKIFLGSSGSMFIGYTLSVLVMFQSYGSSFGRFLNPFPISMPLLILSVPLIDTLVVSYKRFRYKQPIFKADKNHLHHRLRRLHMSDKEVVLMIFLITLAVGINATLLYRSNVSASIIILVQAVLFYFILFQLFKIKERRISLRQQMVGGVAAQVFCDGIEAGRFNGFIIDLSSAGISFCILNLEKKYLEHSFFLEKQITLEYLDTNVTFHTPKPFQTIQGNVIMQENVAENAVKIGVKFNRPLKEV